MRRWHPVALLVLVPAGYAGVTGLPEGLWERIGPQQVGQVKATVAVLGTLLLAVRIAAGRRPGGLGRLARAWDVGLLTLGLLAAACWWNLFRFNYPMFGHPSETYHYYIGSKYYPELGYTRLYQCTALADAAAGRRDEVAARKLRDLETNALIPAATALADPGACKDHFTTARWRSFLRDVAWFRARLPERRWHQSQTDHGYNGTPAWGFFGRLLASTGPASDGQILALRLVDPIALLAMWVAVGLSFGWRTLCVALLYWGTNYPAQYGWVGGSYLRQIEIVALLVALCCLRRRREASAGFLLVLAALARIYPALLWAGPGLGAAAASITARAVRITRSQRRLALGALLGLGVLLPLAAVGTGSAGSWLEFADNSRVLLDTPLRNDMGLRTVLSYDPDNRARDVVDRRLPDPYAPWKERREAAFAERRALFVLLVAGYLVLLALAARGQPDWVAVVLGAGLVPIATELTCYYSALLVVFALLWERHPSVGLGLCALSAAGWGLVEAFHFFDEVFTGICLATVAFIVFATVLVARGATGAGQEGPRPRGALDDDSMGN